MEPKISVIVPIYNVEDYIKRCINSIINQAYKNLEIILVDDGSPDNSGKICEGYAAMDSRIKVIHKENGGLSSARNAGLDAASGDYIAFIDSDDFVRKDMFEILMHATETKQADIAQCGILITGEENHRLNEWGEEEHLLNENCSVEPMLSAASKQNHSSSEDIKISVLSNIECLGKLYSESSMETVVVWNKLYKSHLFKNIRFPVGKTHEDEFITYKLLYKAGCIACVNLKMYYYVQTKNSLMRSKFNVKELHYIEALEERENFFKEKALKRLFLKTEAALYRNLIDFYLKVYMHVEDNIPYLKYLKQNIKDNIKAFIKNPYISRKSKFILALMKININFLALYVRYLHIKH